MYSDTRTLGRDALAAGRIHPWTVLPKPRSLLNMYCSPSWRFTDHKMDACRWGHTLGRRSARSNFWTLNRAGSFPLAASGRPAVVLGTKMLVLPDYQPAASLNCDATLLVGHWLTILLPPRPDPGGRGTRKAPFGGHMPSNADCRACWSGNGAGPRGRGTGDKRGPFDSERERRCVFRSLKRWEKKSHRTL